MAVQKKEQRVKLPLVGAQDSYANIADESDIEIITRVRSDQTRVRTKSGVTLLVKMDSKAVEKMLGWDDESE